MEKKITIDLSGQSFYIEEEAFQSLQTLFATYQEQLDSVDDELKREELIQYLERLIADQLSRKASFGMTVVTTDIIEQIGQELPSPNDLAATPLNPDDEEPAAHSSEQQQQAPHEPHHNHEPRRLYRDTQHRIIGGIAAGLAYFLGVDVTIIRIIMIILGIVAFPVIAVYLILWLLLSPMPQALHNKYATQWHYSTHLCRIPAKGKIGGVAAGLADFFKCDALWIRLVWLLLAFPWLLFFTPIIGFFPWIGGLLLPAYFILWIILPVKPSYPNATPPHEPKNNQSNPQPNSKEAQPNSKEATPNPSEATFNQTGAQEFASTINDRRPPQPAPQSNWFNRSAGCAIGGCGCLLLFFAVPILIGISIFFPSLTFWLDPAMIHSPNDFFLHMFTTIPPHLVWILSLACTCFLLIPLITIIYSIIANLLDLPRIPAFAKAVLSMLWALAIIALIYMVAHFYFGFNIFNGSFAPSGLTV